VAPGYLASAPETAGYTVASQPSGVIETVAGAGVQGYTGDGGAALDAEFGPPQSVAVDSAGNLFIADSQNNVIRKVAAATGVITTVAGNGTAGYRGDGGPATAAELSHPAGIAVDRLGNLYIADTNNCVIRKVTAATGSIAAVAGNRICSYSGDGGTATAASLAFPSAIALDSAGDLWIADTSNGVVREVSAKTLLIATVVGTPRSYGFGGDGGPATVAELNGASSVAPGPSGSLYLGDGSNARVRKVTFTPTATPVFSATANPSVKITDANESAAIYFTTDGATPTTSSAKYTGAITVSATETIQAIALAPGYAPSAVASAKYIVQ